MKRAMALARSGLIWQTFVDRAHQVGPVFHGPDRFSWTQVTDLACDLTCARADCRSSCSPVCGCDGGCNACVA